MFQDFREYLGYLERKGKLLRVKKEVDVRYEIAAGIRKTSDVDGPALLFENIKGYPGWRIAGGIFATQKLMALALGLPKNAGSDRILRRYLEFDEKAVSPRLVSSGPVKEVILKGKDADLTRIPIPTYSSLDAGPYITAGVDFARNPDTGIANVSMHRQKVMDKKRTTFLARGFQHLARQIAAAEKKGKGLGIAVAIGLEPAIVIASQLQAPFGVDETGMAGALRGAPVEMVKCETIDAEVPAHAELVIEGRIVPGEKVTDGPFGEYPGNYSTFLGSPQVEAPLFEVTAITMRKNPIFQAMLTGFPLPLTENHILRKWAVMAPVYRLASQYAEVLEVHPTDSGGGQGWLVVKIKKTDDSQPRKIIDAIFHELRTPRQVTVVDDDIDIHNPAELEWAVVTRAAPDKNIIIIPRDPPRPAKWGIDATMPVKERQWYERTVVPGVDKVDYL
ncbi:MAG: UbiD family decarboxylase [Chloroflexota bacterium]